MLHLVFEYVSSVPDPILEHQLESILPGDPGSGFGWQGWVGRPGLERWAEWTVPMERTTALLNVIMAMAEQSGVPWTIRVLPFDRCA